MKKIRFILLLLLIGLFFTTIFTLHCTTKGENTCLSAGVDTLFSNWDKPNSPGCALAVIKDGKIIYKRGYGMADLEHDIPISSNTVFYIGSISKQFVAMCMLLLEQDGLLSLDDDIRKYLPDFPEYDAPIKIHHLIYHTSGIRDYFNLWKLAGKDYLDYMPEEAVYQLICSQKELNFTPGEKRLYSNSGYFLLSIIIKNVSKKSLREYAKERIFKILDMKNSHFHDNNKHIIKNRAFGYAPMEDGKFANLMMRFDLVGSGGLYTTVDDLYLWDQNFYHNILGKNSQKLIDKMLTSGKLNNGTEVNYACALIKGIYRGAKTVAHEGALGGYRAQLLRFPDHRFSFVILSNLESFNAVALAYKVADAYLEEQLEPAQAKNNKKDNPT